MFEKPLTAAGLDQAILNVLEEMKGVKPDSEEYAKMVNQLSKLHAMKVADTPKRVSKDTWANIVANILGIALILNYERTQIVTGRALNFVQKLR